MDLGAKNYSCCVKLTPEEVSSANLEASLSKNLRKMFDEAVHTDFVVKATDANGIVKEFKVHKSILSVGSVVFAAMLSNPELKECSEGVMKIEDIRFEVLGAMFRFLYTGGLSPEESKGLELGLLIAADKYQIDGLKKLVEHRLIATVTVKNVCELLVHAERLKAAHLKVKCAKFIRRRRKTVVKTGGWKELCALGDAELMGSLVGAGSDSEDSGEEDDEDSGDDDGEEDEEQSEQSSSNSGSSCDHSSPPPPQKRKRRKSGPATGAVKRPGRRR